LEQAAEHKIKPVFAFLPAFPVKEQATEVLVCLGSKAETKIGGLTGPLQAEEPIFLRSGQLSCPRGKPQTQFFSGQGRPRGGGRVWVYFDEAMG
jgi:hypothetical protein